MGSPPYWHLFRSNVEALSGKPLLEKEDLRIVVCLFDKDVAPMSERADEVERETESYIAISLLFYLHDFRRK